MKKPRHENDGLQKICKCGHQKWAKCPHAWHFSFQWKTKHHRFSIAHSRADGSAIDSKTKAEAEADRLRSQIRLGTFDRPTPKADMTVRQLADEYLERYVKLERTARERVYSSTLDLILRTPIKHPGGGTLPLGDWPVADVVPDTIKRFRETKLAGGTGVPGTNRLSASLRAMWAWGLDSDYATSTPFKKNGRPTIKFGKEPARSRRLDDGEEGRLLAASGPHLQALILAAVETGMRRGEILSLTWAQVEGMTIEKKNTITWAPRATIFLPHEKTKTKQDRRIPISTRLRGILEMRRFDPAGHPHLPTAYVFGTEVGTRVLGFKRAWITAVLKAHGQPPTYTGDSTANFDAASRAAFRGVNLHFHDLRREAGSRWMDGGVPIATIQRWLGHSNVSQTSTYLAGTETSEHDAMARFEARKVLVTSSGTPGKTKTRKAGSGTRTPRKTGLGRGATIN